MLATSRSLECSAIVTRELSKIHALPNAEKIEDFMNLVKALGYKINTNITEITTSRSLECSAIVTRELSK